MSTKKSNAQTIEQTNKQTQKPLSTQCAATGFVRGVNVLGGISHTTPKHTKPVRKAYTVTERA